MKKPAASSKKEPLSRAEIPVDNSVTCRIEAVLSVDARGQVVLPKGIRTRAHIGDGDKLALVSWERNDTICCLALIRTDALSADVEDILRPILTGG